MWAKYWAFQGMLALGSFDKTKKKFNKRTATTTKPFIDLDREALALSMDFLIKHNNGNDNFDDEELEKLIKNGSFAKIYCYIMLKLSSEKKEKADTTLGKWIKYRRYSDPLPLVESLKGQGTGWCTAGESTAKKQLDGGDFYVYYSYNEVEEAVIPRIAIRMNGNEIAEIRGVAENQNIESEMEGILEQKLNEFPDKDKYNKKVNDMKFLTMIHNKFKENLELGMQ